MRRPWEHSSRLLPFQTVFQKKQKTRARIVSTGFTRGAQVGKANAAPPSPALNFLRGITWEAGPSLHTSEWPTAGEQREPDRHPGSQNRAVSASRNSEQPATRETTAIFSSQLGPVWWVEVFHLVWGPYTEWAQRQIYVCLDPCGLKAEKGRRWGLWGKRGGST